MLILLALGISLFAREKPNILWITSEDNSAYMLGCYGNRQAQTPNIDAFAKESVLFENAYSHAPVCAVARATILMGAYSPTMGTQHMRSRHTIPAICKPNPEYLRAAGYHCTNPGKTDYNFRGNDKSYWKKGDYKKRPDGKPFFCILNFTESHESSIFGNAPAEPKRLKPGEIDPPPYIPDLTEIRKDKHPGIRTTAAQALYAMRKKDIASEALVADVASEMDNSSLLNLLNTLRRLELLDRLPESWAKGKNMGQGGENYIQRFSKRTKE